MTTRRTRLSDRQRRVLIVLINKSLSTTETAQGAGLPRSTAWGVLGQLRRLGLVKHRERVGFYRVDAPPDWLLAHDESRVRRWYPLAGDHPLDLPPGVRPQFRGGRTG